MFNTCVDANSPVELIPSIHDTVTGIDAINYWDSYHGLGITGTTRYTKYMIWKRENNKITLFTLKTKRSLKLDTQHFTILIDDDDAIQKYLVKHYVKD